MNEEQIKKQLEDVKQLISSLDQKLDTLIDLQVRFDLTSQEMLDNQRLIQSEINLGNRVSTSLALVEKGRSINPPAVPVSKEGRD